MGAIELALVFGIALAVAGVQLWRLRREERASRQRARRGMRNGSKA
jgi:uncharacterized iron-regulated membrane protein